jgi:hypothetical protein
MMTPTEALLLRDIILAEARARGVPLEEHSLRVEYDLPVLRLRLGEMIVRGTRVRLPARPGQRHLPDVITVHASGDRASRMWPRKRDGTFNIEAVVDHLLALVTEEASRTQPVLNVDTRVPTSFSGLHVIKIAGVFFGTLPPQTKPVDLLERVQPRAVRDRINAHLEGAGLTDGDLRVLGDAAGLFFGRATKIDFNPFEHFSNRFLKVLRLGMAAHKGRARGRHVLVLGERGGDITVADPSRLGVTTFTSATLSKAWKLGTRGTPWLGTIGPRRGADPIPGSRSSFREPAPPPAMKVAASATVRRREGIVEEDAARRDRSAGRTSATPARSPNQG